MAFSIEFLGLSGFFVKELGAEVGKAD